MAHLAFLFSDGCKCLKSMDLRILLTWMLPPSFYDFTSGFEDSEVMNLFVRKRLTEGICCVFTQ